MKVLFLLLLLLLLAAEPAAASDKGWASFSAAHTFGPRIDMQIGTLDTTTTPVSFWFRRTIVTHGGKAEPTVQIDTHACPALLDAIKALRTLPMPRFETFLVDTDLLAVTADGVGYTLDYPAAYPGQGAYNMRVTSNLGTPLAEWVETTLKAFDACAKKRE